MDSSRRLLSAALESDESFRKALVKTIDEFGMTVQELAHRSGVSPSTLYKIINEDRSPSLDILRKIVSAVRGKEGGRAGNFIALIVTRQVLD